MVCNRCKMVVKSELEKLGLHPIEVELGEVVILESDIEHLIQDLQLNLESIGFSIIDDKKSRTIEKVKELLMYDEMTLNEIAFLLNYSSVAHLSNQFKKVTGFSPSYFKQLKEKKRRQIEDI